jgi:hypothetical protein
MVVVRCVSFTRGGTADQFQIDTRDTEQSLIGPRFRDSKDRVI